MASTAMRMAAAFFCWAPYLVTWLSVIPFCAMLNWCLANSGRDQSAYARRMEVFP